MRPIRVLELRSVVGKGGGPEKTILLGAARVRDGVDGRIVPMGDVDALAAAMAEAVDDPERRASWARSARRRVETDLSFDTRMDRVEAIYEGLVERFPQGPKGRRWPGRR